MSTQEPKIGETINILIYTIFVLCGVALLSLIAVLYIVFFK